MKDYTILSDAFSLVGHKVSLDMHHMNQRLRALARVEEVKQSYGMTRVRIVPLDPITGNAFDSEETRVWVDAARVRVVG